MSIKPTGTSLLGWCMTGHHDRRRKSITLSPQNTIATCTCKCHEGES